jgi:hypothetical protein
MNDLAQLKVLLTILAIRDPDVRAEAADTALLHIECGHVVREAEDVTATAAAAYVRDQRVAATRALLERARSGAVSHA